MHWTPIENNPLYIGCLFGLFSYYFIWSILDFLSKNRQRQRALRSLAADMELQFFRSKLEFERSGLKLPPILFPHRPRKTLLGLGPAWDGQNISMGEKDGLERIYLERDYQEWNFRSIAETLAVYGQKGVDLPYFELVPLRLFDKFHRRLELDPNEKFQGLEMKWIELTDLGSFRRHGHHLWGVAAEEGRYAQLFPRDFLELLLRFPNWRIKGQDEWMMIFEENFPVPIEKMEKFAGQSAQAASLVFSNFRPATPTPVEKPAAAFLGDPIPSRRTG